jgi:transcriptional regulator with XRE-family HTH domain
MLDRSLNLHQRCGPERVTGHTTSRLECFICIGLRFLMTRKKVTPMDRHVGTRIRMQRLVAGMSQTELGEKAGVSFQQIQKYEKGKNRVSASRLQQIADALMVPPEFFFHPDPIRTIVSASENLAVIQEFTSSPEGIALSRAFLKIQDPEIRRRIVHLVEELVQS